MATFRMVFGTDWGLCKLSVRGYFEKGNKKDKKKIGTALVPNFIIPKTLARTLYLSPKEVRKIYFLPFMIACQSCEKII